MRLSTAVVLIAAFCVPHSGCALLSKRKAEEGTLASRQVALRGIDAMQRGQYVDAEPMLRHGVEACPFDERIRRHYAETLWELGSRPEAVANMEQAVRLSGGNAKWVVRLGEMYLEQGQLSSAAEQASVAVRANRQLASAWALQGDVLRRKSDEQNSLAAYHRALSLQRHYPRVQLVIADIYRGQGRHGRELATLRTLADGYSPEELPRDVVYLQGLALKGLKRYDMATAMLDKAARQGQPSAEILFQLAEAQYLAGDPANARLTVQRALAQDPNHVPSRSLRTQLVASQQRIPGVDYRL